MKKIAFTMGDPAGIGPEIIVKVIEENRLHEKAEVLVYGSKSVMDEAKNRFAPNAKYRLIETDDIAFESFTPGILSETCGLAAYNAVKTAAQDAFAGTIDAMVTAPVNKAAVNLAGIPFTGHTELVAEICEIDDFAMMQSDGSLRVVFATTHIALKDVPQALTRERIIKVTQLLHDTIVSEGVPEPLIAIAALNPHAGENGHMGCEDEDTVKPAMRDLEKMNIRLEGPFPSDTLFIESTRKRFDGIVSMYHDQGHIPFKMLAFDRGVNSTLGLPIIRTSVDHGTAFEIAWRGTADTGSLLAAFNTALIRAKHRKN